MFFKKKKHQNLENPEELFKSTELQQQKMPIAILDHSWHQLTTEIKTPQVQEFEKELTELLKEQGKLNTDYTEYTQMKKGMLDTILNLTHEAFELKSNAAVKKIDDQQKMILNINEKLEKIEKDLEVIPKRIQEVNGLLLDQTVQLCYGYINEYREKSEELDEEIQIIRKELMTKTDIKKTYDKKIEQLYQYLHQLVGANFIEKLDKKYWEKEK